MYKFNKFKIFLYKIVFIFISKISQFLIEKD